MHENCIQPFLLNQFGNCTDELCLKGKAIFDDEWQYLSCIDRYCHSSTYPSHEGLYFKILVQFNNLTLLSKGAQKYPSDSEIKYWQVKINNSNLLLITDNPEDLPAYLNQVPTRKSQVYSYSILLEALVAGIYFWLVIKNKLSDSFKLSLKVILINLITLPIVWYVFPALGYFHYERDISFGIAIALFCAFYAHMYILYNRPNYKKRGRIIVLTVISFPIASLIFIILSFFGMYSELIPQGIPGYMILFLDEVFAFLAEAFLLSKSGIESFSKKDIWLISFIMNAASFLMWKFIF